MVSGSPVVLTVDGMQQLQDDLRVLCARRANLIEALSASVDASGLHSDLGLTERRIAEVQNVLARAMPLDPTERVPGVVGIGSRVTVRWEADGDETYTIVEPAEVAPHAGRISHESPVGRALFDRRVGERVSVATLAGPARLEVLAVE
jgi:transcription elongation factor GreA